MTPNSRLTALAVSFAAIVMPLPADAAPERDPALLERKNPDVAYVYGEDFTVPNIHIPAGNVVAPVEAVDAAPADPDWGSDSGCEARDFAGFTAGNIALIRRGLCISYHTVLNAQDAGAAGVLIFNWDHGLSPGALREDVTIPVLFITKSLGEAFLAETQGRLDVHMLIRQTPRDSSNGPPS
jgi:hypothetical protein